MAQDLLETMARLAPAAVDVTSIDTQDQALHPGFIAELERIAGAPRTTRLLPCIPSLPCWMQPGCTQTTTTYKPPTIQVRHYPVRITQVTFRPFKGKMDGVVNLGFQNESQEAVKTQTRTCHCKGGNPGTTTSTVPGSATLNAVGAHTHWYEDLQKVAMDLFKDAYNKIHPGVTATSAASFQRSGIINILQAAIGLIKDWALHRPQRLSVSVHIDTNVAYNYLGKPLTRSFKTDWPNAPLPVDKINVDWSAW